MENSKNFRVLVEQVDRFSCEFEVRATSEEHAKSLVEGMIEEDPLDCRKNTFDGTEVGIQVVAGPIEIHTVESLFNMDEEECTQEVILLSELTSKQRSYLGLASSEVKNEVCGSFQVFSSGGSLKVNSATGFVIECMTEKNEDNELKQIIRFDLDEYKKHYNVTEIPGALDILDLGYWLKDGEYEQPVQDWRDEIRRAE